MLFLSLCIFTGVNASLQDKKPSINHTSVSSNPPQIPRLVPSVNSHISVMARVMAINNLGVGGNPASQRPTSHVGQTTGGPLEFRPFSSLEVGNLGVTLSAQNPLYNQHQPPRAISPPSPNMTVSAAAFASTLLSPDNGGRPQGFSGNRDASSALNPKLAPDPGGRAHRDLLLGDFSQDFDKLSMNTSGHPSSVLGPRSTNNNVVTMNNNVSSQNQSTLRHDKAHTLTPQQSHSSQWTAFD